MTRQKCVLGSSPRLTVKAGGAAPFSALRIPHPVASREERRGVPCTADSRHTHTASSSSSSSFCTEAGLLCPINSTDSQLLLSPSKPLLNPPSTGCTQIDPRSSQLGLTQ
ncbi:hypothetical protein PFLUV_G00012230 [Perca fluviatilis]|uniref:Uncharacterized protein n=1 Tax=Perca fluviatilis TaxID=8168 RepID=A0A6A5FS59_PERFL|nr:hypothetical protein PFLUV_G00012230 [Perca fluviatilis]